VLAAATLLTTGGVAQASGATTVQVSVSSKGAQGNNGSFWSSITPNGRYVAFESAASNLVPGDTNGALDVFERDLQAGTTRLVSVTSTGGLGNGDSGWGVSISADGRYVAFESAASNLVPGDTNSVGDIFVRDLQAKTTRRISVTSTSAQANSDSSYPPVISADGRYVAFVSDATNLVPGDTNGVEDVFVRDLQTGTTRRVSVTNKGGQGNSHSYAPAISANGRYVAFDSEASNLVLGDTNHESDVFVRDLKAGTTRRVSVSSTGAQAAKGDDGEYGWNPISQGVSITPDGRYVAFDSNASNLVSGDTNKCRYGSEGAPVIRVNCDDVFVHDLKTGTTTRVSVSSKGGQANSDSSYPVISANGRYVAFLSCATNLIPGGTTNDTGPYDLFVHDLQAGTTRLVSVSSTGAEATGDYQSITADGRYVTFASYGLVPGSQNEDADIYLRGPLH
jgi:Tol biopolymer transport system component